MSVCKQKKGPAHLQLYKNSTKKGEIGCYAQLPWLVSAIIMNLTGNNLSTTHSLKALNEKPLIVHVVVGILLYVNGLMIFTFLKKETFRGTRYILFAQTLFADTAFLLLTDLTLIGSFYQYPVHIIPCCITCAILPFLSVCTPLTLAAMCLERYVAICLPLRHASISTPKNTFIGLLIVWGVSLLLPLFILIVTFAYISPHLSYVVCTVEIMLQVKWLADMRVATLQLLFIIMLCITISTYIKIMIVARSASSENKKSTNKGLKTVLLHGIQLILCMTQFITPYIEMPLWKVISECKVLTFHFICDFASRYESLPLWITRQKVL